MPLSDHIDKMFSYLSIKISANILIREEYPIISWVFFRMPFLLFFRDYPRWLVKLSSGPHEDSFVAG